MEQRVKHSEHVGSVLTSALRKVQAEKEEAKKKRTAGISAPQHFVQRDPNRLPIRVALKRRKLISRGSGVYEDEKNGDLWFREGEYLIRQNIDIGNIVENYMEQCKGT